MRILLVTQHYRPETVGTAQRATRIAHFLSDRGHEVHVVTGVPNHPSMDRYFRQPMPRATRHERVQVHRVPVIRFSNRLVQTLSSPARHGSRPEVGSNDEAPAMSFSTKVLRSTTYGSWVVTGTLRAVLDRSRWDVVVAISPLTTALVGALASIRHRVPLIFDVQDIWPDAAIQAGILSNRLLAGTLEVIEGWCYSVAAGVVTLSDEFAARVARRGVPEDKIHVIPNAPSLPEADRAVAGAIRKRWGVTPEDTVVLYAGNLGLIQDLDVLVHAAARLRDAEHIHIVIVGDGVDRRRLEQHVADLRLKQVRFESYRPPEELPGYLSAADVLFLSLRPGKYTPGTIPSKLYDYLGAGRPVVNLVAGAAAEVVDEAAAGMNIAPGDTVALEVVLRALHSDPRLRRDLGANGRAFVRKRGSWQSEGSRYLKLIDAVVAGPAS